MADEPMKDPYKDGIDFAKLARDDPDFAKVLQPPSQLDFTNPSSVLQLTKSLLKRDFDLTIDLPSDRLCPPVPNRLNYILFIDSLLRSSAPISLPKLSRTTSNAMRASEPEANDNLEPPSSTQDVTDIITSNATGVNVKEVETKDTTDPTSPTRSQDVKVVTEVTEVATEPIQDASPTTPAARKTIGLDIGTGASVIYPLLGCRCNPSWSFLATDIDAKSILYARQNIAANGLEERIRLIEADADVPLIPLGVPGVTAEKLEFVVCNPPFYSSSSEMETSAKGKNKPPNSACTGSANEMICEGGEVAFIGRIVGESLVLRERVRWYTSMVGKLSSLVQLIERLQGEGCVNWAVGELVQGSKTRRWVLGWSWTSWRPAMEIARGVGAGTLERKYLPFPSEYNLMLDEGNAERAGKKLDEVLKALKWSWTWDTEKGEGVGFSEGNVWSRSARRKMKNPAEAEQKDTQKAEMEFGVRITVKEVDGKTEVLVRWLKGEDSVLFESFCGMVKRTVEIAPKAKRKAADITS